MKFYLLTKHKKVKVSVILSAAQTTQKRDDIFKKSSEISNVFFSYVKFYENLVEKWMGYV